MEVWQVTSSDGAGRGPFGPWLLSNFLTDCRSVKRRLIATMFGIFCNILSQSTDDVTVRVKDQIFTISYRWIRRAEQPYQMEIKSPWNHMDRIWDSFRCIPRHLVTSYQVKVIRCLRGQKWQGKIGPWPSHNLSFQFSSKKTTDQKTLFKRHKSGKNRKSEKYQILRK